MFLTLITENETLSRMQDEFLLSMQQIAASREDGRQLFFSVAMTVLFMVVYGWFIVNTLSTKRCETKESIEKSYVSQRMQRMRKEIGLSSPFLSLPSEE